VLLSSRPAGMLQVGSPSATFIAAVRMLRGAVCSSLAATRTMRLSPPP
jgi:hypothetical protein